MAQAGQVFVNFGANTQGLLAGTARAGNILQRFSQTGIGAAIVMGASFVTLSRLVTGFATNAIGGFKDFNYHIVRAQALSGATTAEFIKMRDVAEELGRTTEWMAKDIAEGMSNLALAGFNANEIIVMIPDSLRLATAGALDLAKTNTIMANAIRGFSLDASQANQVANVMTATFTTTNTTLESLAETFKNAVGVLGTLGVKMEEVAGAAGVLGDVGISASVAGTGLKNFGIKLASTFGMMQEGAKTAKEFFESLGVTKDRLFDATTGTLNMVEAVKAFKQSMDKLGEARAPEFLAQFSKLFGARAAASLTALVRQADQFQIQTQNTRMTEMIGDVQQVFEQMQGLNGQTLYMTANQEGLHKAVLGMVSALGEGNSIMEEFVNGGGDARMAIERISGDFEQTSKVMEKTFGSGSEGIFSKTTNGLLEITKYSRNNSKEMLRYGEILDQLAKGGLGTKRTEELKKEAAAMREVISTDKRSVQEMTSLGRARIITLAAQIDSIKALKADKDIGSKAVVQLEALNKLYKGNEGNILLAANAMGIEVSKGDKLVGTLGRVKAALIDTKTSTEKQQYAMERLVSQTAMTNTAMDMQRTQLETLDGTFKLFQSGIELVSNKIAMALAPALDSTIKSATIFLRALTLNNDEISSGVTATQKLNEALNDTFVIFKKNGGILSNVKKGFEGLSSIGKTLAVIIGSLGAAGLAAGGAFVWIQALLPALTALAGVFFSLVLPIVAIVTIIITLGIKLKEVHDKIKASGQAARDMADPMIKLYTNIEKKINDVKQAYDNLINSLEKTLGLTNKMSISGGNLVIFGKDQEGNVLTMKDTLEKLDKSFQGLEGSSKEAADKLISAYNAGNAPEINKLLKDNSILMDKIAESELKAGFATKAQMNDFRNTNTLLDSALKSQESATASYKQAQQDKEAGVITEAKLLEMKNNSLEADKQVNDLTKKREILYNRINKQQGRIGVVSNEEKKRLQDIQTVINKQSKAYNDSIKTYEDALRLNKTGVKNWDDVQKKMKEAQKQHELLVGSQKEYNKILDQASSRNPFVYIGRMIKNIVAGKEFQGFLADVAVLMQRLIDTALKFISIVGPPFMKFMSSVIKGIVALWPSINKLFGAILNLFDSIFTTIGFILVDVFGFAEKNGKSVVESLSAAIEKVAIWIDGVAKKIKEMPLDRIKELAVTFGVVLVSLMGLKAGMGVVTGIASKFIMLNNAAATLLTNFTKLFPMFSMPGLMAGFNGLIASVGGLAPALGIVLAIIAAVAVVVTSMFIAFKNNFGGFRDAVMTFVGTVITQVAAIAARAFEMFASLIDLVKSLAQLLAPIIGAIMAQVLGFFNIIIKVVGTIISRVFQIVTGVFEVLSGIFSGDFVKIGTGLIDIIEGIVQIVMSLIEGIMEFILRLFTSVIATGIGLVQTAIEYVINALEKIPFFKEKFAGVHEIISSSFEDAQRLVEAVPKALSKVGDLASKTVGDIADKGRSAIGGKTTADKEIEKNKKAEDKAKAKAKAKAEKQAQQKIDEAKRIQDIAEGIKVGNDYNKRTADNTDAGKDRPNVTTNTVVEYKAAEDDEVNRRMIERIMNDVLKAGVGMEMGDSSGVAG
ncbi:phage tail tape measure protein [Candidatus Woesebacteria bacterium RBG_13_36_22]|uniref:Phage tail tape measure protein n=1 Tax=Candidatus Woesebacteria bacterium RBG_13_36_22 TaxID=1802478 RepID=A0A1F7WZL4_9BACT|nr:MAG: phage tail tape measure protein [Candidatus Woesebacteria bacterium RBG_13_36_22]